MTSTSDRDTVLVISGEDATARAVMAELRHHPVEAVLLEIGEFPSRQSLAAATTCPGAWSGRIRGTGVEVTLSQIRGAYYRRPTRFSIPEGLSAAGGLFTTQTFPASLQVRRPTEDLLPTCE